MSICFDTDFEYNFEKLTFFLTLSSKSANFCVRRGSRFALSKMVGMDDKHRKLLRKKRMDLVRDMDGDRIASFLFSSEIFSEEDKDLVQVETTSLRAEIRN